MPSPCFVPAPGALSRLDDAVNSTALPPLDRSAVPPSLARRLGSGLIVLGLHLLLIYAALYLSVKNELIDLPPAISVRLLPLREEKKAVEPAKPLPPAKPVPPLRRPPQAPPEAVLTANSPAPSPAFVVAPQPPVPPAPVLVAPAPAPVAMVAARFDADYLHNPKPLYPAISRRNGEEGKVLLKVRVSPQGEALSVAIAKSSGHDRLDAAASEAVTRWRFVPARRGDEPVEAAVIVPVTFALE
ncbi:MAG: energy transducer TonB [Proteobacteria bacterium]|nr:energy transducer TonB [Pseudomonadota bacterium]